jgi:hypothetical protein
MFLKTTYIPSINITDTKNVSNIGKIGTHFGCCGFCSHQQGLKGGQGGLIS